MARIRRRPTPGQPGFKRSVSIGTVGRRFFNTSQVSKSGARRLFRRDPAKGVTANIGTSKDVPIFGQIKPAVNASLTTALAGANNDLKYTAKAAGPGANAITVAYVVAGANTPLTVGVVGNAITVNVATSAGAAATSTAAQVMAAVQASVAASALVTVALATGNDGTGVVTALAPTNLAGGANAVTTDTQDLNTVGQQSPGVKKAPSFKKKNAVPTGQTKVAPGRSTNRRIRRTRNN